MSREPGSSPLGGGIRFPNNSLVIPQESNSILLFSERAGGTDGAGRRAERGARTERAERAGGRAGGRAVGRTGVRADGRTNGRAGGRTGGRAGGRADGRTGGRTNLMPHQAPVHFCYLFVYNQVRDSLI